MVVIFFFRCLFLLVVWYDFRFGTDMGLGDMKSII